MQRWYNLKTIAKSYICIKIRLPTKGLPMFVSMPHFLNAEDFLKNVSGLLPSEEKHNYNLRIEPLSGTTIKSNIRVQFNFHLKKNKKFK